MAETSLLNNLQVVFFFFFFFFFLLLFLLSSNGYPHRSHKIKIVFLEK